MARYADIDKAMELATKTMVNGSQDAYVVMGLVNFVENILHNAEADIVECRECKYRSKCRRGIERGIGMVIPLFGCSAGESDGR